MPTLIFDLRVYEILHKLHFSTRSQVAPSYSVLILYWPLIRHHCHLECWMIDAGENQFKNLMKQSIKDTVEAQVSGILIPTKVANNRANVLVPYPLWTPNSKYTIAVSTQVWISWEYHFRPPKFENLKDYIINHTTTHTTGVGSPSVPSENKELFCSNFLFTNVIDYAVECGRVAGSVRSHFSDATSLRKVMSIRSY